MSKSSFCFYLMLQQTCCMHSLASKLGCYVSIHMHKYQEFIQVNLRISKVPSYWSWSPLLKSCSFSDEPPYSRTPLIRDSRVMEVPLTFVVVGRGNPYTSLPDLSESDEKQGFQACFCKVYIWQFCRFRVTKKGLGSRGLNQKSIQNLIPIFFCFLSLFDTI